MLEIVFEGGEWGRKSHQKQWRWEGTGLVMDEELVWFG